MATNTFLPVAPALSRDIKLGEGIVYKNYGEAGEAVIGATKGGSRIEIERIIYDNEYDGANTYTKNLRRYTLFNVKMIVNFLKLNYVNLAYGVPCTVTDGTDVDGTYKEIRFNVALTASDILTNVAFVGENLDGDEVVYLVKNTMNMDNISWEFTTKEDLISEMTFTGFYTYASLNEDPIVPPFEHKADV